MGGKVEGRWGHRGVLTRTTFLILERDMAVDGGSQSLGVNETKEELKELKKSLQGGRGDAIAADMVSDDNLLASKSSIGPSIGLHSPALSAGGATTGCSLEPPRLRITSKAIFLVWPYVCHK